MNSIQLYGGPSHGRNLLIRDGLHRFEVTVHHDFQADRDRYRLTSGPVVPPERPLTTYYMKRFGERGVTKTGSAIRREITIGLWENGELFPREKCELHSLLIEQPWTWKEEPNILTHFHRWWEKKIHENGWQEIHVW